MGDDACGILEALKILLICFKFLLPASEHGNIGFPHHLGKFLIYIELKHDSLDELQNFNKILVPLDVFIFAIPPSLEWRLPVNCP